MSLYRIIKGTTLSETERLINNASADGWTIVDETFSFNSPYYTVLAYREMTREEEKLHKSKAGGSYDGNN